MHGYMSTRLKQIFLDLKQIGNEFISRRFWAICVILTVCIFMNCGSGGQHRGSIFDVTVKLSENIVAHALVDRFSYLHAIQNFI